MSEIFKTVLILSALGFCLIAVLLILKPYTVKKFPAKWQYWVWIAVLMSMIVPAYKLIPVGVHRFPLVPEREIVYNENIINPKETPNTFIPEETTILQKEVNIIPEFSLKIMDLLAYAWVVGMFIYLGIVAVSYIIYISGKKKNAVIMDKNIIFDDVKKELNIKRNIRLRMSKDFESPMLVGIFLPVIYIPFKEIPDGNLRMIFLHELTHYKRGDLLIKWFSLLVNAVHWFNPLSYLLCANISEFCEISCDMEVTKKMSEEEQKNYMKTILDLAC